MNGEINQNNLGNTYTISQASKKLGVPIHKLRYFVERTKYEVTRDKMGNREFTEIDIINIKKLMEVRKSSISYEAIGKFILKGNPIDPEAAVDLDENDCADDTPNENSLSQVKTQDTVNALISTMTKFQNILDSISTKMDKIDKLDDISDKLKDIDKLAAAEDIADLKKEVLECLGKNQQMIELSNRELEQRVSNMSLDLKETLAKRREEALKEKKKSFFSIFFSNK